MTKRETYQIDGRSPFLELERRQREQLMLTLLRTVVILTLGLAVPYALIAIQFKAWQGWVVNIIQVPMLIITALAYRDLQRGEYVRGGYILFPYLLFIIAVNGVMVDAVHAVAPAYLSIIVVVDTIMGTRGTILSAALSFGLWLATLYITRNGLIPPAPFPAYVSDLWLLVGTGLSFVFVAIINHGVSRRLHRVLTRTNFRLIEANRQLDEANQLKSRFVARVSHDLRSPLNAITLSTDLALRGVYGEVTPDQTRALERTSSSARRLQELVEDILDLTRIEAGQLDLKESAFDVSVLLDTLTSTFEPAALAKGIEFSTVLAPDMPPHIVGDKNRLIQILTNLADNAVKFTEMGGVTTTIEPLEDDRWHIVVQDSGRGIHERDLETIFDEFRQGASVSSSMEKGSGLGLAITRNLAELMQGEVRVESKIGKGSRFEVILPLKVAMLSKPS